MPIWKWKRKSEKPSEPVKKQEAKRSESIFSTDAIPSMAGLGEYIRQNAFQKTAPVPRSESGAAITFDGMDTVNGAYALGDGIARLPQNLLGWYVSQGFIGYQACAIIAQQWLVDKACTVAPKDAIRKGYEITANAGAEVPVEAIDRLKQIDKEHRVHKQLVEFAKFNRVFGIRIAVFHVESDDPNYYTKPFNLDGVRRGSYKGFSQVDPYWITPELDMEAAADTGSRHFYEPTWWRINGKRYHRSHLVVIRHSELADVMKPSYIYGGIPLPQKIYERVYAAERTANEAPLLAMTKRTTSLKVDMDAVTADEGAFQDKLARWIALRDNHGIKVIGQDEELAQTDTALGDLDNVIMTQYQIVAAIANTPATKLLGTQPKGFNSTGEYEEAVYHEYLESIQTDEMQPLLDRHHQLAIRSDLELEKFGVFDVEVQWRPLDSMTENEVADVQLKKAQTAQLLQSTGAIDGQDIRGALIADKFSGYNGLELETEPDDILGGIENEDPLAGAPEDEAQATAAPVANQTLTNLTGKQFQHLERIMRKVRNGSITPEQGSLMLQQSFGFTPEQAGAFISVPEDTE